MSVAGKHQSRALAESMYSPSEGLKEINHQLSTGIAEEITHYCNSLGQGLFDCLYMHICVCSICILMFAVLFLRWRFGFPAS